MSSTDDFVKAADHVDDYLFASAQIAKGRQDDVIAEAGPTRLTRADLRLMVSAVDLLRAYEDREG